MEIQEVIFDHGWEEILAKVLAVVVLFVLFFAFYGGTLGIRKFPG